MESFFLFRWFQRFIHRPANRFASLMTRAVYQGFHNSMVAGLDMADPANQALIKKLETNSFDVQESMRSTTTLWISYLTFWIAIVDAVVCVIFNVPYVAEVLLSGGTAAALWKFITFIITRYAGSDDRHGPDGPDGL